MDNQPNPARQRWLEIIHTSQVSNLAKRHEVKLEDNVIRFLEGFAEVVHQVTAKQRERRSNKAQTQRELDEVNNVVQDEVRDVRKSLFPNKHETERYFYAIRHDETYLPVVHFAIKGLPELIVHVTRAYATRKKGICFGIVAKQYLDGHLTGAVARAANYLRHKCRAKHWDLTISEVVNIWYRQALEIPPEERTRPVRSSSTVLKRGRSRRRRALAQRGQSSPPTTAPTAIATTTSIAPPNKVQQKPTRKRRLREDEGDLDRTQNRPQKQLKTRKLDEAFVFNKKTDTQQPQQPEQNNDSCCNANVDTSVARITQSVDRRRTEGEDELIEKPKQSVLPINGISKAHEPAKASGEALQSVLPVNEISKAHEPARAPYEARQENMINNSGPTENAGQDNRSRRGKLEAADFLMPDSYPKQTNSGEGIKQVDVDEGFDTLAGMTDYDLDDSDFEGDVHDAHDVEAQQKIQFEFVDDGEDVNNGENVDNRGDGSNGADADNGAGVNSGKDGNNRETKGQVVKDGGAGNQHSKAVEMDPLHTSTEGTVFASARFSDALNAVNLAGNNDV